MPSYDMPSTQLQRQKMNKKVYEEVKTFLGQDFSPFCPRRLTFRFRSLGPDITISVKPQDLFFFSKSKIMSLLPLCES